MSGMECGDHLEYSKLEMMAKQFAQLTCLKDVARGSPKWEKRGL